METKLRERFCEEYYKENKDYLPEWQEGIDIKFYWKEYARWLENKLQNTSSNSDYAKLPTIEECYQAIPFPSNERDYAMFVAGIAECHKFVSRHFA